MSHHDCFLLFKVKFIILETNEIDLVSMSGDMITFIIPYYLNICITFCENILKAVPVFVLTKKKK
jgi:hypothetical protein